MKTPNSHQAILKLLQETHLAGKLHHAYCFCGPSGIGKSKLAKKTAKIFLGENPENHVDSIILNAEEYSSIADVRAFIESFRSTPLSSKGRVGIILNADFLTHQSQNALLKTIEEPPSGSLLLLTVHNKQKILPTIGSRVAALYVRPLTMQELATTLKEEGMPENDIKIIQDLAAGRVEWALNHNSKESMESIKSRVQMLKGAISGNSIFKITEGLFSQQTEDEKNQNEVLKLWISLVRSALRNEKDVEKKQNLLRCAFALNSALTSSSKENTRLSIEQAFLNL